MKRPHILLVDDEPMVRRILSLSLQKAGYEVELAANGRIALESVRQRTPGALITDIEMPEMSGRELCQQIMHECPARNFPIFVATSLTALEHREWSGAIPDLHFLEKPVSARQLVKSLDEYFAVTTLAIAAGKDLPA